MTISQISAKIDSRLNKSASGDYDNIWSYQKKEAFNKAINEWVRRQKIGKNQEQEGDEETDTRVDDLQCLLVPQKAISVKDKGLFAQTEKLPTDYLYFKRLTPLVSKNQCSELEITSHLKEEANVDILKNIMPSLKFEETFHTIIGNKIHIYHNKDFTIDKALLTYYRKPLFYDFKKLDVVVEFKDDVCEIITDEAVKILASDMESGNQKNLAQERGEENT